MAIVSSHTLNGVDGTHAGGIAVTLARLDESGSFQIFATEMDAGGRLSEEINIDGADPDTTYEMVFKTKDYWKNSDFVKTDTRIIPEIVLRFQMPDPDAKYHMPVILSPNGYSCWCSG